MLVAVPLDRRRVEQREQRERSKLNIQREEVHHIDEPLSLVLQKRCEKERDTQRHPNGAEREKRGLKREPPMPVPHDAHNLCNTNYQPKRIENHKEHIGDRIGVHNKVDQPEGGGEREE
eukprot:Amastigsp_a347346_28.p3 type:complete len:119 gc:universal Amastigsp_a347346_28:759-1115(+)